MIASAVEIALHQRQTSPSGHREDLALQDAARRELEQSGYHSLKSLDCRVEKGIVNLAGTVPCYFLKQVAQALVLRIERVKGVTNQLHVE